MNYSPYKVVVVTLSIFFLIWLSCSVDLLSPEALQGDWTLLTFTDKQSNITFENSIPRNIGSGLERTMRGWLVITQDREIDLTIWGSTTFPDGGEQSDYDQIFGPYSLSGATLTIVDKYFGGTKVFSISRNGFRITLEDDGGRSTWGKGS